MKFKSEFCAILQSEYSIYIHPIHREYFTLHTFGCGFNGKLNFENFLLKWLLYFQEPQKPKESDQFTALFGEIIKPSSNKPKLPKGKETPQKEKEKEKIKEKKRSPSHNEDRKKEKKSDKHEKKKHEDRKPEKKKPKLEIKEEKPRSITPEVSKEVKKEKKERPKTAYKEIKPEKKLEIKEEVKKTPGADNQLIR